MQGVEPAKGGRGKKGGLREAARNTAVPETTARRRQAQAKVRHNTESAALSRTPETAPDQAKAKPTHNTNNGSVSPPPKTSPNPDPLMLRQPCTETFQADATVFPLKPARNFLRSSQSTNFFVF